jgi:proline dehydrogenase
MVSNLGKTPPRTPLSVLPLITVVRSLAISTISASPRLLPASLALMSLLANTQHAALNPDHNPLLHFLIKRSLYAQFCAGETPSEVRAAIDDLKQIGYTGVILGYAREVVLTEEQTRNLSACDEGEAAEECLRNEITPWAEGTMETLRLAAPGDYVALK